MYKYFHIHPLYIVLYIPTYKPILQQFAKAYGIKVRCYGEHVGEHIENLMGTHWEYKGNIMGTHWEQGKNEKKTFYPPPTPPPTLK